MEQPHFLSEGYFCIWSGGYTPDHLKLEGLAGIGLYKSAQLQGAVEPVIKIQNGAGQCLVFRLQAHRHLVVVHNVLLHAIKVGHAMRGIMARQLVTERHALPV